MQTTTFAQAAENLTPEIYTALKQGIELGRWPNGQTLTKEQKGICLEAILRYEFAQGVPEEERTGYLKPKPKKDENAPTVGTYTP